MLNKICGMLLCIQKSEGVHNRRTTERQDIPVGTTTLVVYKPANVRVQQTITKEEARTNMDQLTVIPPNLDQSQVWNCDKFGIDPKGVWHKISCVPTNGV